LKLENKMMFRRLEVCLLKSDAAVMLNHLEDWISTTPHPSSGIGVATSIHAPPKIIPFTVKGNSTPRQLAILKFGKASILRTTHYPRAASEGDTKSLRIYPLYMEASAR
jgi:hypothetical protein